MDVGARFAKVPADDRQDEPADPDLLPERLTRAAAASTPSIWGERER